MPLMIVGESGGPQSDPEAQWYEDAIDRWRVQAEQNGHEDTYAVHRKMGPRVRPGWFSASELGYDDEDLINGYRGQIRYKKGAARELRLMDNGSDRDAAIKADNQASGLSVIGEEDARNVQIAYLRVMGSLDDIVRNPETGACFVFEFKTINPFAYGRLTEPKPEHRLQVQCYMAATAIHEALVQYESKGDQARRTFYVPFDAALWNEQAARLIRLRREAERRDAALPAGVKEASLALVKELSGGS